MPDVSYSMLKAYRRCPKQYEYKYVTKLGKKKPLKPLLTGSILHEMLDARATGRKNPQEILSGYAKQYKTLFREEQDYYGNLIEDISRIYASYEREYCDEDLDYEESETAAITDLGFELRYCGTIDKICVDRKTKRRWIMDHKCHRSIPGEDQRLADFQLVLYVWAWNRWNPARPVDGIIWDYLRTKPPAVPELLKNGTLTKRENLDTDYATYNRAIRENGLDPGDYSDVLARLESEMGAKSRFFKRIYLPAPSKSLVESIVEDARVTGTMMNRVRFYPRNTTRDCSWCEYYNLCQAELRGLDVDFIRKKDYEHREPREYGVEENE